ncbi:MAG: hypothetical protein K8I27_10800 [Planctomycetes bacterium]|nr:hypothetical protein [Planctomycetota bacterium]
MRYLTLIMLFAVFASPARAQMGDPDADRAAVEAEESAAIGATIIRSIADAQALPEDVTAVYSLSKLDDAVLLELKKRESLKVLHFSLWSSANAWITDSSLKLISSYPSLESLTIVIQSNYSGVGVSSLAALKQLKVLKLTGHSTPLDAKDLEDFSKHPALQELEVTVNLSSDLIKNLTKIPGLVTLKLTVRAPGKDPLKGIDKCKKLEVLTLCDGVLPAEALEELKKAKSLKSLRLEGRILKEWNATAFEAIGELKGLERLELAPTNSQNSFTAKELKELHNLKDLAHLGIESDFSQALTLELLKDLLGGFENLTSLGISHRYDLDMDVVLALAVPEKLRQLTFRCGKISDDSFKSVLESCTGLESLDIHADGLSEAAFEGAIKAATALKELSYYESGRALFRAAERLKTDRPDLEIRRIG